MYQAYYVNAHGRSNREQYCSSRWNVKNSVYAENGDMDLTTGRVIHRAPYQNSRRSQCYGVHQPASPYAQGHRRSGFFSETVPMRTYLLVMLTLFVVLGGLVLCQHGNLQRYNSSYNELADDISRYEKETQRIQSGAEIGFDIEKANNISQQAVNEMGMIHAHKAQVVSLVAVDAYEMQQNNAYIANNAVADSPDVSQPTQIPMVAYSGQ